MKKVVLRLMVLSIVFISGNELAIGSRHRSGFSNSSSITTVLRTQDYQSTPMQKARLITLNKKNVRKTCRSISTNMIDIIEKLLIFAENGFSKTSHVINNIANRLMQFNYRDTLKAIFHSLKGFISNTIEFKQSVIDFQKEIIKLWVEA